jgi:prolyl-tRNA synthetase
MLIPTIKETPSDAEVISHKLMLRAGMIRKVAAGVYNYLPLGLRVVKKVENIVREEMNRAGAHEVLMPMVVPAELWQESKRWDYYGKELLRIKDRHERDFCLGPTHEEVITDMVRREVRSYRQLPINLYQIQTKFRDEIRPRFGLMRGREFIMKDAYSFHANEESAEAEYRNMYETYCRIFERCGLKFRAVEADTGAIGGSFSHEFMVLAESGEDAIASCDTCSYAANVEKAPARSKRYILEKEDELPIQRVSTPGKKSVEEVTGFLKVSPERLMKTLIFKADGRIVAALVRGDHEVNEVKLKNLLHVKELTLADQETVERVTKAPSGFAGPVGLEGVEIYADHTVEPMSNFVVGGNEKDVHLMNVNIPRDFNVRGFFDLRKVVVGDHCPHCDGRLELHRGIEVGHIFKLGTKYSEAMGATFLDESGTERVMIMGCYGIGIGRTAAAAIEQWNDENGIVWPKPIAPFQVVVIPVNPKEEETMRAAEGIYKGISDCGVEALLDDRDERPGVKFKDADLIGIPVRITIGAKTLKESSAELKLRKSPEMSLVKLDEVVERVKEIVK